MRRTRTLPLGIDLGRRRIRVALATCAGGEPKLIAVAARERGDDPAAALRAAVDELQTTERRCVLALAPPEAVLAVADLPPMSPWERLCAARFEAAHFIDYPLADAAIAVAPTPAPGRWALGIARRTALRDALATAHAARLRTIAVDDIALALQRAYPQADAVVDVGEGGTRVTLFGGCIPTVTHVPIGGARLTAAVARSLGVDLATAEDRKTRIGFGGAGEGERDALLGGIAGAIGAARAGVRTVVLCGNGSRIPGFDADLARVLGRTVANAALEPAVSDTLPPDVLRAAAADWSVAYGLCLWSLAA